jgi:hypothetical protein
MFEQVLGLENPDTMTARGNLTYWTEKAASSPGHDVD